MLEGKQQRDLKARAHHLRPVIMVGTAGLTEALFAELDNALEAHELIKVKLPAVDRDTRTSLIASLSSRSGAELVQNVGRIAILYRPRPADDTGITP